MIQVEKKPHRGWENACHLSNGRVELTVLSDLGPRIVAYGLCGKENQFHEFDDQWSGIEGKQFHLYGGHRL